MTYQEYVKALEGKGLSRQQIAALLGIHDTALSRRVSGKHTPVTEAQTTIAIVYEIFSIPLAKLKRLAGSFPYDEESPGHIGWLVEMAIRHNTTGLVFE